MYYEQLFSDLQKGKIRYLVVGGVAMVLHGFVRATVDLDLMVALDTENLKTFLTIMTKRGYKPKVPVPALDFSNPKKRLEWKKNKGMMVFSFYHPQRLYELIDVFIHEPIPFDQAYKRRKVVSLGKVFIPVIGKRDLETLKRLAGRPQDLEDLKALKRKKGK